MRITPKTRSPFTIKALSISGVTWKWHFLNHAKPRIHPRPENERENTQLAVAPPIVRRSHQHRDGVDQGRRQMRFRVNPALCSRHTNKQNQ